jgi:polyhydroxybutyrate depolymerase
VAYHDTRSTAAEFLEQTGLAAAAEQYHFVVVLPQSWDDGPVVTQALLADVAKRYTINQHRVYGLGYASGGSFVLRLAATQPALFSAVAAVSPDALILPTTKPTRNVPIMVVQGGADPIQPKAATGKIMNQLVQLFGCQTAVRTRTVVPGVTAATYPICAAGMTASYLYVENMGHVWPGAQGGQSSLVTGPASDAVNATDLTWQFLGSQSR